MSSKSAVARYSGEGMRFTATDRGQDHTILLCKGQGVTR